MTFWHEDWDLKTRILMTVSFLGVNAASVWVGFFQFPETLVITGIFSGLSCLMLIPMTMGGSCDML